MTEAKCGVGIVSLAPFMNWVFLAQGLAACGQWGEARQCVMSPSSWTHSAQEMSPRGPAARSQSCPAVGEGTMFSGTGGPSHSPAPGRVRDSG